KLRPRPHRSGDGAGDDRKAAVALGPVRVAHTIFERATHAGILETIGRDGDLVFLTPSALPTIFN
ncbi:MAG: hypothetical protein ACK48P_00135, partial [Holosporales bacterium]